MRIKIILFGKILVDIDCRYWRIYCLRIQATEKGITKLWALRIMCYMCRLTDSEQCYGGMHCCLPQCRSVGQGEFHLLLIACSHFYPEGGRNVVTLLPCCTTPQSVRHYFRIILVVFVTSRSDWNLLSGANVCLATCGAGCRLSEPSSLAAVTRHSQNDVSKREFLVLTVSGKGHEHKLLIWWLY
jgi:hypothetical protein